jgi:hypothetical protein
MGLSTNCRRLLTIALAAICMWLAVSAVRATDGAGDTSQSGGGDVFTPAHPTLLSAVRDFFGWRSRNPAQPIAFTHAVHLANGLQCDSCHAGAAQGPIAGIPSVKFCMSCHLVIAAERPEIKKIAAYQARGEDIPWVRVYDYNVSAHVRFNHAPHIRAQVMCATCHGDMTKQTTARRVVDLNMGNCIACHKVNNVSVDCQTCHF